MNDKTELKKSLHRFHGEASRLLNSEWEDAPRPIQRFLQRCEADGVIGSYLRECAAHHLPEGFDAASEYDRVSQGHGTVTFGPFSTVPEEESAQTYLILREIVKRNTRVPSTLFMSYGKGFAVAYERFLKRVAEPLIHDIEQYLTLEGLEKGLDDGPSVSFNGPVTTAQINQASGGSIINATQTNGLQGAELETLMQKVLDAASDEITDAGTLSDVKESIEELKSQMESGSPKHAVMKGLLRLLRGVKAGESFVAAVTDLINFFTDNGFFC